MIATNLNKIRKYRGVTAVEAVVYLAIFSAIFLTMVQYMFAVGKNNQVADYAVNLEKNTLFITEHIRDSFAQADSISEANSVFDNDNGVLSLVIIEEGVPVEVRYEIEEGRVQFRNTAGEELPLSQNQMIVTRMHFEEVLDADDNLVGVRASFTLTAEDFDLTREFETSYIVRKAL